MKQFLFIISFLFGSLTYGQLRTNVTPLVNGGTGSTTAPAARTALGATTIGSNIFTLTNPGAITFPRFNADNTADALSASDFRTAIGAGTSSVTAHSGLTGLTTGDDHTHYTLNAGRSGGQTIVGGTATTDDLILQTTSGVGATGAEMLFKVGNAGGTTAMTILNDGKVGVGVSPVEQFQVALNFRLGGAFMPAGAAGSSGNSLLSAGAGLPPTWGTVSLTTGVSGTLAAGNGGTGLSSLTGNSLKLMRVNSGETGYDFIGYATAATASVLVQRDADANVTANNLISGYTTTATAAGTTTLTVGSTYMQYFTGSTTQTVTLPVTSTLTLGHKFEIINNSSGNVTINSSGGNVVIVLAGTTSSLLTCILTSGTTAASWTQEYNGVAIASSKKVVQNNSITYSGTDGTTMTFPGASQTIASLAGTETLTNKRVTKRTGTVASSATPTINTDNVDYFTITAQTVDITSMTTNLSGTPSEGDELRIEITGTASRAITWGASFAAGLTALPTTTSGTSTLGTVFTRRASLWIIKGTY